MKLESSATAGSKIFLILGWVLTAIPVVMMAGGGIAMIFNPGPMQDGMKQMGFPAHAGKVILALEIASAILYAIPRTAILGAILLTGYLGGAIATHVRADDGLWFFAAIFSAIVWLGVYFRDRRVRALIPLRSK